MRCCNYFLIKICYDYRKLVTIKDIFIATKTSAFGGVTLSGDSAVAFEKQFLAPNIDKKNLLAQLALEKGRVVLKEIQAQGYEKSGFKRLADKNNTVREHIVMFLDLKNINNMQKASTSVLTNKNLEEVE